jgi:hypothetical protein
LIAVGSTPALTQLGVCEQQGTCEVIEDTGFVDSDWTKGFLSGAPLPNPGTAIETAVREIDGGRPGAWRRMTHELRGVPASLHVYHLFLGESYDPGRQGAVTGIDYSHSHTVFVNEVRSDVIVEQGGRRFRHDLGDLVAPVDGQWVVWKEECLRASDFIADDGGGPPDFSAAGAPLRFGYSRRNNDQVGLFETWASGIDNFRVTVYRQPNSRCVGGRPLLRIEKTDNGRLWGDGPLIRYELTVTNEGGSTAAGSLLTETVPEKTGWSALDSTPGWDCFPGSDAGSNCLYQVPSLAPGEELTVVFAVQVVNAPNSWEVSNLAELAGGEAHELTPHSGLTCACLLFGVCLNPLSILEPRERSRSEAAPREAGDPETAFDPVVLFKLRDRLLRHTAGGRRAIELFYDSAGDLVSTVGSFGSGSALGKSFVLAWQPLWRRLIEDRGDEVAVTAQHTQALLDYVNALELNATSAGLEDSLALERARLDIPSWVGMDMNEWLQAINVLSCEPNDRVLCLNGGRFRVETEWLTDNGDQGHGHAVPLTGDTGYFWFFDADNVELVLKVLDACPSGFHNYWVFAGGLTDVNVKVTVTDTETGQVRTYLNPQNTTYQPIQDTSAFATCDAPPRAAPPRYATGSAATVRASLPVSSGTNPGVGFGVFFDRVVDRARRLVGLASGESVTSRAGNCAANASTLCLGGGRFAVTASWQTAAGANGAGHPVQLTADTGYFWFFNDANVEIVVKTLDACASQFESFWVFAAGLTDVKVDLTVTDTVSGQSRTYRNAQRTRFLPIQDTSAFRTCNAGS